MTSPLPTNGNFKPSEMVITNQAYRDFLLHDEHAVISEEGTTNDVAIIASMLARMYEESGLERVHELLKIVEERQK